MDEEAYKRALTAAMVEHEELTRARADIDKRIARLAEFVESVTRLLGDSRLTTTEKLTFRISTSPDKGLTELIRQVLKADGSLMTPSQVRKAVEELGLKLRKLYANPSAVIHTTLKRLHEQGEVDMKIDEAAGKLYRWAGSTPATQQNKDDEGDSF